MGLKPPPREHVVATGRMTAVVGEWRRQAESHPPFSDVAAGAVEVEAHDDQVLVVEAVVDEAGLVMSSMRWLSWCPKLDVGLGPLASPPGNQSRGKTSTVPLSILAKMALRSLELSSMVTRNVLQ